MFTEFFYVLKDKGLEVSLTEWITFMEALDKGLADSSLDRLYYLGRMILVKTESDYDKYDLAFMEYFKNIKHEDEIPAEIMKFLDKEGMEQDKQNIDVYSYEQKRDMNETKRMMRERISEQKSEHNGGNYWIGTSGGSAFGHSGRNKGGISLGGKSGMRSAFQVNGERKYVDFRHDKTLDIRQFQVAFRKLRQFSSKIDIPRTELDLDKTIDSTCNNGGYLKLEFDKPRKNTVKLLLLFFFVGTMYPFMELCNSLFHSAFRFGGFLQILPLFLKLFNLAA